MTPYGKPSNQNGTVAYVDLFLRELKGHAMSSARTILFFFVGRGPTTHFDIRRMSILRLGWGNGINYGFWLAILLLWAYIRLGRPSPQGSV